MVLKIIGWLIAIWLVFWLLGILLLLLPTIFFAFLSAIALLCIYSLLPSKFRINAFEQWLGVQRKPKTQNTSPVSSTPINGLDDSSNSSTNNNRTTPESDSEPIEPILTPPTVQPKPKPEPELMQPELRFDTIKFNFGGKLPDREELKASLKKKVIGQDTALETLVRVVLGKLASKNNKPLVVFLPGPTGSGKTELSKALAETLKTKLTRFDMGEYAESHKASNLFGSPKGYVGSTEGGALPNALRTSKKTCILLFDEVEKANQSLWRQLLAFFDEGRVSDTIGQTLAPKNTICLLTSNLEADKIAENPEAAKDIIKQGRYFPPEFLGRIDKVIPLLRLDTADTARLTVVLARRVADRFDINLIIEQEALEELVNATFDEGQKYGGRGIMEKVGDLIGDDLLDLQGQQIYQAKLIVENDRLKAVPLMAEAEVK
ncbi:MAG: AAA family ATPase [Pleurocapsa sp. MO_226.B13]|nr:AAA family ATPase [Pleurocapsa sp. MO_226.B13]